jgi:putative phosphoribosyl transferase
MAFNDRIEAGRRLAAQLTHLRGAPDVVIVGLPRGGVPVASEVAAALGAPLDVIVVRKLGVPYHPELGLGAIGEDGVRVINDEVVRMTRVSAKDIERVEASERAELERRARRFRGDRVRVPLSGKTVVVVDDGVATGSTAKAACQVARAEGATRVILAVPVAPDDWTRRLAGEADEFVAVETPWAFHAVGQFYRDFSQTTDDEVVRLLEAADHRHLANPADHAEAAIDEEIDKVIDEAIDEEIEIAIGGVRLAGHLTVPADACGLVIFAHGSGSSRLSPRNRFVASVLEEAGFATLLFDLLTRTEEHDRANVFDIDLLARRLGAVAAWAARDPRLGALPMGFFGASTGAAAALRAAAQPGAAVAAIVSRGGRPDLAGPWLPTVRAPTLLVVGGHDTAVLGINRDAQARLTCTSELAVVPGATHLFEEPGTLRAAAELARAWFVQHLAGAAASCRRGR